VKLGLPEVKLSILPGSRGTQRLFKLIGLREALSLMLIGSNIFLSKARKIELIDELVKEIGPGLRSSEDNTIKYLFELLREGIYSLRIDSVSIDVGLHVLKDFGSVFKDRIGTDVSVLEVMIKEHGILRKKNNKGFLPMMKKRKKVLSTQW